MSQDEMAAKIAAMTPEQKAKLLAMASKSKRTGEEELLRKYPWAKPGTLEFDPVSRKQSMIVVCQHEGCEAEERRYTSDLFQIKFCTEHKKEAKRAEREAKRAQLRKMAEMIQAEQKA